MNGKAHRTQLQSRWLGHFGRRDTVCLPGECPACGHHGELAAFTAREWFRLGPLPVYPLQTYRVFDDCPACRHFRRVPLHEYLAWAREQVADEAEAVLVDPSDDQRRLALAWAWYGLGRCHEALAVLAPRLATGQAVAAIRHCAGCIWTALGKGANALADLRAAADLDPDCALYRRDLGRLLSTLPDGLGLAEHHLAAAAERDREDADTWALLGSVQARRGEWQAAAAAWRRCLEVDPSGAHLLAHSALLAATKRALEAAGADAAQPH